MLPVCSTGSNHFKDRTSTLSLEHEHLITAFEIAVIKRTLAEMHKVISYTVFEELCTAASATVNNYLFPNLFNIISSHFPLLAQNNVSLIILTVDVSIFT